MNTKTLTGLYDRLVPSERVPLLFAALGRDDDLEASRLVDSAPTPAFRISDHYGLCDSIRQLSLFHMTEKLDHALVFSTQLGLWLKYETSTEFEDRIMTERLRRRAHLTGYKLCVEADAWKLVCAEMHIEPDVLLKRLCGFETVRKFEEIARSLPLWTPEETATYLKNMGEDESKMPTVEKAAQSMRDFIQHRVEWWKG